MDAADEIGLAVRRDDHGDRRGVPAGRADARHLGPVLPELRLHRRHLGADEPARRAHDHAADRGLFPARARRPAARRGQGDGQVSRPAQVEPRHRQGRGLSRAASRLLRRGLVADPRSPLRDGRSPGSARSSSRACCSRRCRCRSSRRSTSTSRACASACRRARRSSRPRRSPTAPPRSSRRIPPSTACSSASSPARASSTSSSRRTARSPRPSSSAAWRRSWRQIADAQVNFLSQSGGGPGSGGRDITLYLGSDNPELLTATANKIVDEMATLPELRAPRAFGDLVRPEITDQAALRPRRRPWRHDRRAEPDDPHRDAWRHRPEQRQILARRPPGADQRQPVGKRAPRPRRRSKTCRCRPRAAARCR